MHGDEPTADDLMRRELIRFQFAFERPNPVLAWTAFKSFVLKPIPNQETITIGFICHHVSDRDDVLWLDLVRQLEDPSGNGRNCGCLLSRTVPQDMLGVGVENWWWKEHLSLDEWFAEVEANTAFQKCLALTGWKFEGFSS